MNELALFAGGGGGILGGLLLGWRTRCAVEINPYARKILLARQRDGILEPFFPIWDDVRTFDGRPWRGSIDVISGGFPCQDISAAGKKTGIEGEKSGLWRSMARIVDEVRPVYVFVENSPSLVSRGLSVVLGDLTSMGFNARWCVLGAGDAGAPHKRDRIWILGAHPDRLWQHQSEGQHGKERGRSQDVCGPSGGSGWWATEPAVCRMAHGVASRMDRLTALGNGQVCGVVPLAWRLLTGGDKP